MATSKFEQKRIKELQDERETIQKKTFTKWTNSFLEKASLVNYADTVIQAPEFRAWGCGTLMAQGSVALEL
jgi:hypothetical protein